MEDAFENKEHLRPYIFDLINLSVFFAPMANHDVIEVLKFLDRKSLIYELRAIADGLENNYQKGD